MVRSRQFRSSYIKRIGRILRGALIGVGFLILFVVNNGNILTDGRRYRKRCNLYFYDLNVYNSFTFDLFIYSFL